MHEAEHRGEGRRDIFRRVWRLALEACSRTADQAIDDAALDRAAPRATVPYLTEPWYC